MKRSITAVLFVLTCVNAKEGVQRDIPPGTAQKNIQGGVPINLNKRLDALEADNVEMKNRMGFLQKQVKILQKENINVNNEMASFRTKETVLTKKVAELQIEAKSLQKEDTEIKNEMASNARIVNQTKINIGKLKGDVTNFNSMFQCTSEQCTSITKQFVFPKGVIVGKRNSDCNYGDAILSVDGDGSNCPSGKGSVTFGQRNRAPGESCTVTGGSMNIADGQKSSVAGGGGNLATGAFNSFAAGGYYNKALSEGATVVGGWENTASGTWSIVGGGSLNTSSTTYSSKFGGINSAPQSNLRNTAVLGTLDEA